MSVAPLLTNNLDNSKQKTSNSLSPAPSPYSSLLGKVEGPAPPPSSKISWSRLEPWPRCRKVRYLYSGGTETLSRWAWVNTRCADMTRMKQCKRLFGHIDNREDTGGKVSVSNSAARLPVRHFRRRRLRTSSFFSRYRTMPNVHARLCSTWRIPRTEVMTSPPTVFPAEVALFWSHAHIWLGTFPDRILFATLHRPASRQKKKNVKPDPSVAKYELFVAAGSRTPCACRKAQRELVHTENAGTCFASRCRSSQSFLVSG